MLLGIERDDTETDVEYIVRKIHSVRLWDDWKNSVKDKKFEILLISQFTIMASMKKGNKPDFRKAMSSTEALVIFNTCRDRLSEFVNVECGFFGQHMTIDVEMDGPVTILIDSKSR